MATGTTIQAAGGLLWRQDGDCTLFAVVHRPRYDDWSLPKGKLTDGETSLRAAVREVREETGLRVTVGRRLAPQTYRVPGGRKSVDYWTMRADGEFIANDEVDELVWLPRVEAARRCSYDDDHALVDQVARWSPRPIDALLVRHAWAGTATDWAGPDEERPLDERGRAQAAGLADVLALFAPSRVFSASPLRCRQTVAPLADRVGLPVQPAPLLGEDRYWSDPVAGRAALAGLLGAGPTVICSQGGVIPDLVESLHIRKGLRTGARPGRAPARKASIWALTSHDGRVVQADYYADRHA